MKTKNKIEVSVIIPNYNYGHYIKQCINSVLESEFQHDMLEIIIVDDASTDDSINIIEGIQNNAKAKIHLIKQSINLGLAKSRNAGIKNASGNYLFFLDSDNYISKSCLKMHFYFLSKNVEYAACYAPIQKFEDRTARILNVFSNQEYDYDKLMYGNYIDAMSMIKKRDLIDLGLFDEEMPYSGWEDYELWLRMGSNNKKVYFIEGKPLSYYRIHDNSMIRNLQSESINKLASYISEKYTLEAAKKNDETPYIKIQCFWAGAAGIFLEEWSVFQFVRLQGTRKSFKFELGSFDEGVEFIRFDLGDDIGLINIHSIDIKGGLQNIKWSWDKCSLHAQQNLILVKNKELWPDSILQISRAIDPAFTLMTGKAVKELSSSGFSIEMSLSGPDTHQLNFLNTHTQPLTCFSESEFTILEQQVFSLNVEKNTLLKELDIKDKRSQNLDKENAVLFENNKLLQQFNKQLNDDKVNLNNDKLLLNTDLHQKNELIIKATGKIEELEKQLIEKVNNEVAQMDAHRVVAQEYHQKFQVQEKLFQKKQDELIDKIGIEQKKVTELNNQIVINQIKLNELQLICAMKEEKNNELISKNNKIEKELNTLADTLSENLKQKNELIAAISLHLSCIERLVEEKKEVADKYTILLNEILSVKLEKQQTEMYLTESHKNNRDYELLIKRLEEDNLRFKNQKLIAFIKGKINNKKG
ncbi:glycosyltransferase [Ferruginibacter paludis]|uniref:glycosyltransferase n=1 Tax=Ferruginibacter paludis TaxID=1310417 RepID=UPI0025B531F0|nr:glycosyltransferase [Ferruginibacter paludis]MDN3654405.1 glycosyltransferase [Ferruginibacter paludis]